MATRKENADAIKAALGTEINTDRSDPKADLLTRWAEQAKTDPDGTRLEILTWQVEDTLNVELSSENATVEQLQGWLDRAATDPDAVKAEIQGRAGNTNGDTTTGDSTTDARAAAAEADTVRVTVNAAIAAYDGTYADPDQPDAGSRVITGKPVTVHVTAGITEGLRTGTLVEVK